MRTSFDSLMQNTIIEIYFLAAFVQGGNPGTIFRTTNKSIVAGYIPDCLKEVRIMINKIFTNIEYHQMT
jgi:hypothetical protein